MSNKLTLTLEERRARRAEVEAAAAESNYDFSGISKPATNDHHYGLSYESFVGPLVKAMQEQQELSATCKKKSGNLRHCYWPSNCKIVTVKNHT